MPNFSGSGHASATIPVRADDFLERIAPPGRSVGVQRTLGAALAETVIHRLADGINEVIDDVIVVVETAIVLNTGTPTLLIGRRNIADSYDNDYFVAAFALPAAAKFAEFSVLKGSQATLVFAATADTVAERTITSPGQITMEMTVGDGTATGAIRVFVRSHFVSVNYGSSVS